MFDIFNKDECLVSDFFISGSSSCMVDENNLFLQGVLTAVIFSQKRWKGEWSELGKNLQENRYWVSSRFNHDLVYEDFNLSRVNFVKISVSFASGCLIWVVTFPMKLITLTTISLLGLFGMNILNATQPEKWQFLHGFIAFINFLVKNLSYWC